jgi:hypothetical protein
MNKLAELSNEDLLIAMAMVTEELTKRGMRARLKYVKHHQTSYSLRIQMSPFSAKIKIKK